ncbi:MAG TPA: LysM domain-containing protein [Thermomicrobiales bacterium]|nr:LysM domain-containing protein [Thermomicrobiales bacterium]
MTFERRQTSRCLAIALALALAMIVTLLQPMRASADDTYIVEYGDTLSHIADAYGTTVEALVAANGINNPDLIVTGQVLTISVGRPSFGGPSAQQAATTDAGAWAYVASSSVDPDAYPPY